MTLIEFLLARIAEDEALARDATMGPWESFPDGQVLGRHRTMRVAERVPSWNGDHIARHDPVRVLAECEAKRRIIRRCHASNGYWGAEVERMLALPYADHPDYDEEFAP